MKKIMKNDEITITEGELYQIIRRSMANALKDDWLTPEEFTKKILKGYYDKAKKNFNKMLNNEQKD